MDTIGEVMRHARVSRGLTGRAVGLMVGAREGRISEWENARTDPGPDYRRAYVLAGLLTHEQALLPFKVAA